MNVVKFTLGGKFAFFKKPDVNSYYYFTYGNIHKIALLGIFGAILGYSGYSKMSFDKKYNDKKRDFPEFYDKLRHLELSVVPHDVSISKKVQVFNNSVGYASKEQGGNLIVKEQWLENPRWDIYLALKCEESEKIYNSLQNKEYVYLPYLGKNDHLADISDVCLITDAKKIDDAVNIDSLFIKNGIVFSEKFNKGQKVYKYEEFLPYSFERTTNKYEFENFIYTNALLKTNAETTIYRIDGKNIILY